MYVQYMYKYACALCHGAALRPANGVYYNHDMIVKRNYELHSNKQTKQTKPPITSKTKKKGERENMPHKACAPPFLTRPYDTLV